MTYEQYWALMRWEIAESTGWTLDQIDNLTPEDIWQWESVKDARVKVTKARNQSRGKPKGRRR